MTGPLYEGCWGVTRGGEVLGPIKWISDDVGSYKWSASPFANGLWNTSGVFGMTPIGTESHRDIIAVFATEADADAHLAGGKPDPRHCAVPMPTDSKPVTWPDGVTEMTYSGTTISADVENGWVCLEDVDRQFAAENARQLAALLKAAADYVDGGGK